MGKSSKLELNEEMAKKVLAVVDAGLVSGKGRPEPGHMCVEAAVCFAYGLPHSDDPPCVGPGPRGYKIALNDSPWSTDAARTEGMRAIAIAQLGSDTIDQVAFSKIVSEQAIRRIVPIGLRNAAKLADDVNASVLEAAAKRCEEEGTQEAANAARYAAANAARYAAANAARYAARYAADAANAARYAARYAADAANAAANAADAANAANAAANAARYAANAARYAADEILTIAADICLQALIELKSPGCRYLYLLD